MRALFTILGLVLVLSQPASASGKDVIALSISPTLVYATLNQPVYLTVTITNTSSTPRYIGGDVVGLLHYVVKNAAGQVLRRFPDVPAPPPRPAEDEDWVWLGPGKSVSYTQRLTLSSLGIKSVGRFRVFAALNGTVATEVEWQSNKYGLFYSFAPVTIIVEDVKHDAQRKSG